MIKWLGVTAVSADTIKEGMNAQVLVAFSTRYGATAEIAEKIGHVLRQEGLYTDVLPVGRVRNPSAYKAVVFGSAVYIGKWNKDAARFLKANEKILAEQPVWLFSSGPTGQGDPVELTKGWLFPKALLPIVDRIRPRDITVFHGAINTKKLNLIEKWLINNVKAPLGDFRDWDAITLWAVTIADELKEQGLG